MKKVLIGGFLSLIGSIWTIAILVIAGSNLVHSWSNPPGRLVATLFEMNLFFFFFLCIALTLFGLVILLRELFKKDLPGNSDL